uniref:Major facilitator superfamily (MFS) profile domain-containing protein n=1 Tax=Acrobeloides nanus TaxID=290746 RepID=A0A914CJ93_9BILA
MLGYFCTNYMRTNLGMTMTCMVNSTALSLMRNSTANLTQSNLNSRCTYAGDINDSKVNDYGGTLTWSSETQDWLFTATFWGSLLSTLPGGYLVVLTSSPILILGLSTFIIIISTVLFPLLVFQTSYYYVFASRFLLGIGV